MTPLDKGSMQPQRLHVDIEKKLDAFNLRVQMDLGAEILVLFGPSGSGKTQTLNAIAGLTAPDAGEITLDGTTFFCRGRAGQAINLPARKRRVGYVFQHYALFPHLTALENVAYPLWRQRGAHQRARVLLEQMHLAHLAQRFPHELSGGQQQRVAIARALAAEPQMLLLDEPFSALDSGIRERLHQDLRAVQARSHLVVIYVTHSLDDAFAVGHRLAVVREGHIEQVGSLEAVCQHPSNSAVLNILGIPNAFSARVVAATSAGLYLDWDGLQLEALPQPIEVDSVVTAYIRSEDIKILYPDRPLMHPVQYNHLIGKIVSKRPGRSSLTLRVILTNGHEVEMAFPAHTYAPLSLLPGEDINLSVRKEGLVVLHPPCAEPPDSSQPVASA